MRVRLIPISSHPLLLSASMALDTFKRPQFFAAHQWERGDWAADVDGGPPLGRDRPQPLAFKRQRIQVPARPWPDDVMRDAQVSALNYFPSGGGALGWHTDTGHPGWRVYLARPLEGVPGVFRTLERDYPDERGLALAFLVTGNPADSWHAVRAPAARFSLGLRFKDGPTSRSLGLTL